MSSVRRTSCELGPGTEDTLLPIGKEKEVIELKAAVQKYDWGKVGSKSIVARLYKKNDPNFILQETSPYAELWMGTHPNAPSLLKSTGQPLQLWLAKNFKTLGWPVVKQFGTDLPFLFKALSIEKALSIQAHPSKSHAEQLHKLRPDIYKDSNHKPELAIALTEFHALCGFRPVCEIRNFLKEIPQLQQVIGLHNVEIFLQGSSTVTGEILLKDIFRQLMTCSQEIVEENLASLMEAIHEGKKVHFSGLMKKLYSQYPGDVGCFCIYFLHHVILDPGESLFLEPNTPHAYISGDCIECMACSDNVVRAGLTPKYRDVENLVEMLSYKYVTQESLKFKPIVVDDYTSLFLPPFPDFAVANISIPKGATYSTLPRHSASIILVVKGNGMFESKIVEEGSIIYLPAEESLNVQCSKDLSLYQAFANV